MYKIIDNFLEQEQFEPIWKFFMGIECSWYYSTGVAQSGIAEGKYFYMIHSVYQDSQPTSNAWRLVLPVLHKLKTKSLLRIKANLYPNQDDKVHTHNPHTDYTFPHKAAIFSINTCNGGTIIGGKKIDSVKNRMVIFDGSVPHSSTTCTDEQIRVNIGFNYIDEECLNK
tara:strand:- start:214 stop:720 length:507 start_codon:yes stop_codon:yes gene_type:complete